MKCLFQYKPDSIVLIVLVREFCRCFYAPYLMNEVHVHLSLSVNRNVHGVSAFLCEKHEQQSIKLESAQGVQTSAKAVSASAGDNFSRGTIWLGIPKSWHLHWHPHTKFQPASWIFIVELHAQMLNVTLSRIDKESLTIRGSICRSGSPHNLMNCSLYHCRDILKISSKSVNNCLSNVANRQTDKQTNQRRRKHNLLGGGNGGKGRGRGNLLQGVRGDRRPWLDQRNNRCERTLSGRCCPLSAPRPAAPRSAPAQAFSGMSAHRSARAHPIFCPLRSVSAPLTCCASGQVGEMSRSCDLIFIYYFSQARVED